MKYIASRITDDPSAYNPVTRRYFQGGLNALARLINKIVNYNLSPFSREKAPTKEDGDLIYLFGDRDERVD